MSLSDNLSQRCYGPTTTDELHTSPSGNVHRSVHVPLPVLAGCWKKSDPSLVHVQLKLVAQRVAVVGQALERGPDANVVPFGSMSVSVTPEIADAGRPSSWTTNQKFGAPRARMSAAENWVAAADWVTASHEPAVYCAQHALTWYPLDGGVGVVGDVGGAIEQVPLLYGAG